MPVYISMMTKNTTREREGNTSFISYKKSEHKCRNPYLIRHRLSKYHNNGWYITHTPCTSLKQKTVT